MKTELEESAEEYGKLNASGYFVEHKIKAFSDGAEWQAERMYSEEEIEIIAKDAYAMGRKGLLIGVFNKWFEQLKKIKL